MIFTINSSELTLLSDFVTVCLFCFVWYNYCDVSGESIRFRVTSEAFEESLPSGPPGSECTTVQTVAPYRIIGGINEPGLGLLSWWEAPDQDDGDDNEEQDNAD